MKNIKIEKNIIGLALLLQAADGIDYQMSFGNMNSVNVLFFTDDAPVSFYYWEYNTGDFYDDKPQYFSEWEKFEKAVLKFIKENRK